MKTKHQTTARRKKPPTKTSTSLVKLGNPFHSPELAGLVGSLASGERRSFIQAFHSASLKGQDFIRAVIELKRLTLKAKILSWELVAEDLGFTFNALDARIYRYKHPDGPPTLMNIDSQVVKPTTLLPAHIPDEEPKKPDDTGGIEAEGESSESDGGIENESEVEIEAQAQAAASAAKKAERAAKLEAKVITLLSPLDSVERLAEKLTTILEKVITQRHFKITIEEIAVEYVPVPPVGPDEQGSSSLLKVLSGGEPANVLAENAVRGCQYICAPAGQAGEYSPLAANPYRGCGHGCSYCYVPGVLKMKRAEFDKGAVPREDFITHLTNDAVKYQAAKKTDQQVMLSFTTDPYHLGDTSLTRQTIEVLQAHGFGICTLTKGGTRALRDLDLFRPKRDAFASTLTSLDDKFSRKWERNAALPGDRIKALKAFHKAGIFTWVSLEPTLSVEASLAIVQTCHGFVDLFKIGRANYLKGLTTTTDWKQYTERMIELCAKLKVAHYIKKDLQPYLPAGYPNPLRVEQHR
jgi:DNA repair photolyase